MSRADRRRDGPGTSKPADRRRLVLYGTLGLVALLIVAGVFWASRVPKVSSEAPGIAQISVGQEAPAFSVASTGGPKSVPSAERKPTFLELFATWCPHCQRETAVINSLYDKYGGRVTFVAVSASPYGIDQNTPESQADVAAFVDRFKARYPVAFDPDLKVMKEYLQGGYPTIVVIGRDNKIRSIHDGEIPQKTLAKDLDDALKA